MPRSAHAEHYAGIVREKSRLRAVIQAANRAVADAYEQALPAAEVASEASRRL